MSLHKQWVGEVDGGDQGEGGRRDEGAGSRVDEGRRMGKQKRGEEGVRRKGLALGGS